MSSDNNSLSNQQDIKRVPDPFRLAARSKLLSIETREFLRGSSNKNPTRSQDVMQQTCNAVVRFLEDEFLLSSRMQIWFPSVPIIMGSSLICRTGMPSL